MKKGMMTFLGLFFALSFYVAAAVPDWEFTLSPYAKNPDGGAVIKKRPWIAALETFSINIGVWAFDRYVLNLDYSHISWKSWKNNSKNGWIWCPDTLGTSFFGHPYHGSQFFNSARSLGMNFWESIPFAVGGYLMWGYFMENDQPSKNDLIMTSLAGASLGEVEYRLSSHLQDDTATGGGRTWREILAFVIDPVHGFNRLIYGDTGRVSSTNRETSDGLSGMKFSPGVSYDITFGAGSSEIYSQKPFDLFFLNGEIRYGQKQAFISLNTCGLLWGKEVGSSDRCKSVIGIFQNYDYFNCETIHLGGLSFSGGLVSLFPLGGGCALPRRSRQSRPR